MTELAAVQQQVAEVRRLLPGVLDARRRLAERASASRRAPRPSGSGRKS